MPSKKPARMRAVRKAAPSTRRLNNAAAKVASSRRGKFYAKGNKVYFRNSELLFAGDRQIDAPEAVLVQALPVEGNRNSVKAGEIARLVAKALNRMIAA